MKSEIFIARRVKSGKIASEWACNFASAYAFLYPRDSYSSRWQFARFHSLEQWNKLETFATYSASFFSSGQHSFLTRSRIILLFLADYPLAFTSGCVPEFLRPSTLWLLLVFANRKNSDTIPTHPMAGLTKSHRGGAADLFFAAAILIPSRPFFGLIFQVSLRVLLDQPELYSGPSLSFCSGQIV